MSKSTEVEASILERIRHKGAVDVDVVRMFTTLRTHVWLDEDEDVASARFARRLATVCDQEVVEVPDEVRKAAVVRFERGRFETVDEAVVAFINCYTDFHFGPDEEIPVWFTRLLKAIAFFVQALTLLELVIRLLGLR
ncbi:MULTISPECIES: hypothetical protein [unclassified Haloferax]|jgi:hypothetical protein|uniref:hypothetical protein n=1 Tax=unclassified Haloferax TaxID=2625095 RepID=UPI00287491DE|nr:MULTISPECIES: hypothetical protein [unclassified Haloferax]MDS0243063.1 hypothetical protein [Haloferax sp. S2CR25]MDS0446184.1 hypothetical protein [Haloferax sp. S2CR25-2]